MNKHIIIKYIKDLINFHIIKFCLYTKLILRRLCIMSSHALYNLRKKRHLEINELTEILNKKYGTHYEPHQLYEWENHQHEPKFKDAMILADYFNTSYQVLVESKYKEYQQQFDDVDIRL